MDATAPTNKPGAGEKIILPDPTAMPRHSDKFLRWMWFFLSPYKRTFAAFFGFRVLRYTVLSLVPLMIGLIINAFENGWAFDHPQQLALMVVGFLLLYGVANMTIFLFIREARMEDRMVRGMTLFSVRHMNALPLNWHESQGSGGKLQRVMTARSSIKQIYAVYKWSLVPFIGGIVAIFLSVLMMGAPIFYLALYGGFIISFALAAWWAARKIPELHNRHNMAHERLMAGVYEFVSAVRTVKAFHMGDYIEREARQREGDAHIAMGNVFRATYAKWMVLNGTGFFWISVFTLTGIAGVFGGWLNIGTFATTFFLASALWSRLEEMVYMQDQYLEARNGFMRLTETLKTPQVSYDHAPLAPLHGGWTNLRFSNVDFHYEGGNGAALHGIDLEIGRGEKIALVGRSGAGKTTLVKLLMKQVEPSSGQITVDDTALKHIPTADWLGRIGFVPQDVELFNMNIRDNILLDLPFVGNEDRYHAALKQAALDQLIASLPERDATMVGERGIKLSGGQRQRLGIARALVRDCDVIIFDEATASLDSLSEKIIQDALTNAFAGRTMVMIAHRLSTVKFADRIVVMDHGKIVEQGAFQTLIDQNGAFAKLWAMQSSGFVDDGESKERACG